MDCKLYHYIIIVGIISASLLGVLPCASGEEASVAQGQNLLENNDEKNPFSVNARKYAILLDETEKMRENYLVENPEHKLPILVLFFEQGELIRHKRPPRLYTAICEDGQIVWSGEKDGTLVVSNAVNDNQEVQYFRSSIDNGEIKKLLAFFADSPVWSTHAFLASGGRYTNLIVEKTGKRHVARTNSLYSLQQPFPRAFVDHATETRYKENIMAWRHATKAIFDLIPDSGCPVNIPFKRNDPGSLVWTGFVE